MNRRQVLSFMSSLSVSGVSWSTHLRAQNEKQMVTVVKAVGIPWFDALERGLKRGGADFGIAASMIGPSDLDADQQVRLLDELVGRRVNAIGLVPLDTKLCAPALMRAQAAGIPVITHEGSEQEGRTWNVELIDPQRFGEAQMQRLATEMGEEGEYVILVGTFATPLHNMAADAAVALQRLRYPRMQQVAGRLEGSDNIDTSYKTTLNLIHAHPGLKGLIGFGANGPIGAGRAVQERQLQEQIAVVGSVLPSQARSLILDGAICEGFSWNPVNAGYAMVSLAKLVLDGVDVRQGIEISGLGPATVDPDRKQVKFDKVLRANKATVDDLIALGL